MNVFEKLNEARVRFQSANVKKSGVNKFAGYTYYELSDILPAINMLARELKFICVVNFGADVATLDFVDIEKDAKITFSSPMSKASLKGCHEVQNLGAAETYMKRYLYQHCFEIVENDMLESTMNPNEKDVDELIQKVKAKMNTFDVKQKTFAEKAINEKNVKNLELIVSKI